MLANQHSNRQVSRTETAADLEKLLARLAEAAERPGPLQHPFLEWGDAFNTSFVQDALEARRRLTYGLIVVDGDEATLGMAEAPAPGSSACTVVSKIARVSANIGSRTRRGGQSASRFGRHRDGMELAFLRKVAERVEELLSCSRGMIIAGRADLKRRLLQELSSGLCHRVVAVVDLACGAGPEGLRQAALHVAEAAERDRRQETAQAVERFWDLLERPHATAGATVCYGEAHTAAALRLGAVEQLLLARQAPPGGGRRMQELRELALASAACIVEVEPRTEAECRFCQGFGTGGCLRWPVDPALLEEPEPEAETEGEAPAQQCQVADPLVDLEKPSSEELETASTAPSRTDALLLQWLEGALERALGDSSAAASLAVCAEVVLGDETSAFDERVESVLEMLRAEGVPEDILAEFVCHATDLTSEASM